MKEKKKNSMQGRPYQKYYFKITIFYKIKLICIKLKTILQKLNTNFFFFKISIQKRSAKLVAYVMRPE